MSGLVLRTGGGGGLAAHTSVDAGPGASLSQATWGKDALTLDDIPTSFRNANANAGAGSGGGSGSDLVLASQARPAPAPVPDKPFAYGIRQLDKPRRSGDRIVQRRIAWSATPESVTTTVIERDLARRPDGKLAPSGQWLIETQDVHRDCRGKAALRTGVLADDPVSGSGGAVPATPAAPVDDRHSGAEAMPYLPRSVRVHLLRTVPEPDVFEGEVVRYVHDGHIELRLLRMDSTKAVVIHGTRAEGETSWAVKQADYDLGGKR